MKVIEVTARYRRQVKPRDYEAAEGELTFQAVVEEGDNFAEVSAALLGKAKQQVLYALGITPAATPTGHAEFGNHGRPVAKPADETAEVTHPQSPDDVTDAVPTPVKPKTTRKKATPKRRGQPAADPTVPLQLGGEPSVPAIPIGTPAIPIGTPAIADSVMDKIGGTADAGNGAAVVTVILDENLQAEATKAAKKHGPKVVKDLMAGTYKVAKLGDLTQKQRREFLVDLEGLDG